MLWEGNKMSKVLFTKDLIEKGFKQGLINLILSPNGDGIACKIGNGTVSNWFYFGGLTAEEYDSVEQYQKDIPEETIVQEIIEVLNFFAIKTALESKTIGMLYY